MIGFYGPKTPHTHTESTLTAVATNASNRIKLSTNYVLHIDN
jgi:hypothetical protein